MVPTQEVIKARHSLLQVIFCTTPACENVWTTTSPLFHAPRSILGMMAIFLEMNSKGLILSLKKEKKIENCGLLFTSPIKHEAFQAVVVQQRPRTIKRDTHAN